MPDSAAKAWKKTPGKRPKVTDRILDAACIVFNKKGFAGANLKEIATAAGLTEPTIYQHFNGKEDLLFSVVERPSANSLNFLNEHLQGIEGAHNKLRKLIWAHLRYNDLHREYLKLVLLECRSNVNFYKSGAYQQFRYYSGIVLSLLEKGVSEGVYRKDLNCRLARDLILGLLDFEAYTVLITGEIPEATPDHHDIMVLMERMLLAEYGPDPQVESKRQRIIKAAVTLFAKKGYFGATISEIASSAGVSDGTVYEHFKNKEDLLLSIPEERFQEHLRKLEQSFVITDKTRKLRRFIQYHFRLYLEDYDFLVVYLVLIQLNWRFYQTRAYDALKSYMAVLEDLVREGMEERVFISECNVRIFRNLFFGAFTHMALRWFVVESGDRVDKLSEINEATNMFLGSITAKKS